jgi:hypothetical protein
MSVIVKHTSFHLVECAGGTTGRILMSLMCNMHLTSIQLYLSVPSMTELWSAPCREDAHCVVCTSYIPWEAFVAGPM